MPRENASPVPRGDRVPPHSEEAEKGVLGSILIDAGNVMDICVENAITEDSFYFPSNCTIYKTFIDMYQGSVVIDILTTVERLKTQGRLDAIGGEKYLEDLISATPTSAHAQYYIDIVRQRHLLRTVISCARKAENSCFDVDENADLILSKVEQDFHNITESKHGSVLPWRQAVMDTMKDVENFFSRKGFVGLSSGFSGLDEKIHGMRPGQMIVLAARPAMGKTSLAMNIVENVAIGRKDGTPRPVAIFSLEMSREQLVTRMLCSHAGVRSDRLESGYAPAEDHKLIIRAANTLMSAQIYLDDTGGLDILELRARARRMRKRYNIEFIVIDYLGLLHSRFYASQGRQNEVQHISGQIKEMAKELKLPVLVLSQLNRAPEQRRDDVGVPRLSDLRDSGSIEQDADLVWMLRRPCKYPNDERANEETLAIVDVAKNRNGPTGEIELSFEAEYTRFRDRARQGGVDGIGGHEEPGEEVDIP